MSVRWNRTWAPASRARSPAQARAAGDWSTASTVTERGEVDRVAAGPAAQFQGAAGSEQPARQLRRQVLGGFGHEERDGLAAIGIEGVPETSDVNIRSSMARTSSAVRIDRCLGSFCDGGSLIAQYLVRPGPGALGRARGMSGRKPMRVYPVNGPSSPESEMTTTTDINHPDGDRNRIRNWAPGGRLAQRAFQSPPVSRRQPRTGRARILTRSRSGSARPTRCRPKA